MRLEFCHPCFCAKRALWDVFDAVDIKLRINAIQPSRYVPHKLYLYEHHSPHSHQSHTASKPIPMARQLPSRSMPKPPSALMPPLAAATEFPDDAVLVLDPPALKEVAELDVAVSAARPLA